MPANVTYRFIDATSPEFREASRLRYSVLYEPLDIPESKVDWGDDGGSVHCVAFADGNLAGYGRIVRGANAAQIRHLAVAPQYRGQGIGSGLLDRLVTHARGYGARLVFLNARFTAMGMYREKGFHAVGAIFHTESTHLPHQRMELVLA
jgi:GNAT superfamily N-acetyltransferase